MVRMAAANIGVIGGADGPTAVFLAQDPSVQALIPALLTALAVGLIVLIIRLKKRK